MLLFHALADSAPEERSFKVSIIDGTDESMPDIRAAAEMIVRQYDDQTLLFALTDDQAPDFRNLLRKLYQEHRSRIYNLVAQEFTYGFRDGNFLQRQLATGHCSMDVRSLQADRAQDDVDLGKVLSRAKEHNLADTVRALMRRQRSEMREMTLAIRQFARACAMKP